MPSSISATAGGPRTFLHDRCTASWALYGVLTLRDPPLALHAVRGLLLAAALAEDLERPLDPGDVRGALLRDLGMLEVPPVILGNRTPGLPRADRQRIEQHPWRSADVLSRSPELESALPVAVHHHERWDGRGYPEGLAGTGIPHAARILAVADTFSALTESRPYRSGCTPDAAVEIITDEAGAQFDPSIVGAFPPVVGAQPAPLVGPIDTAGIEALLGPRLHDRVLRARHLGGAQLETLFCAAVGVPAEEAARILGRGIGTQRTWSASLRRTLACPPRVTLTRFLAEVGRAAFETFASALSGPQRHPVTLGPSHPTV